MLSPYRMIPPTWPALIAAKIELVGTVPANRAMISWPTDFARLIPGALGAGVPLGGWCNAVVCVAVVGVRAAGGNVVSNLWSLRWREEVCASVLTAAFCANRTHVAHEWLSGLGVACAHAWSVQAGDARQWRFE